MRFAQHVSASVVFAFGCALTGCSAQSEPTELDQQASQLVAEECAVPTESVITAVGPDRYLVAQQVALDAPVGKVSAQIGGLDDFFSIALPGATELGWVRGNGKSVGDELNFVLDGGLIRLQVVTRDLQAHHYDYRLAQPALGIAEIASELTLVPCGNDTTLVWVRDFQMEPGVSFDGLRTVVADELANITAHFTR